MVKARGIEKIPEGHIKGSMLPELAIIRYLLAYDKYSKYSTYVTIPEEMRELVKIWHSLQLLHKKYPESDKTLAELWTMILCCYPQLREIEKDAISNLFLQLEKVEVRDDLLQQLLSGNRNRSRARQLAMLAFDVSEGRRTVEELQIFQKEEEKAEYSTIWESSRNFITDDIFELEAHAIKSPGLRWRLACLNCSLGPIRPGDFGFVFARPESGKTTFLADQVTWFSGQAIRPIIWFNNEEQGEKVRLRTYQAALGITTDELWKGKQERLDKYREFTKGLLKIYDDANIHKNEVEAIIRELNPELVVFDQIDKIRGFDADRPDLVFGRIYQWARELAKRYKLSVIGTCQSDGTGEGIKWLTMSHVAEAKTSKQAEADWILGIGRSNESGTENVRYFNISKNKLLGDERTDPNERHGRFEVYIRPMIARYEDLN